MSGERDNDNVDIGRLLSAVADRWWIVLVCTVVVAGTALAYVKLLAKPVYEARALVTYQEVSRENNPTGGVLPSTGVTRENVGTLIAASGRPAILEAAARKAGMEVDDLRRTVEVQPHGDAATIDFVAKSGTAEGAAGAANAYATAFVTDRRTQASTSIEAQVKAKQDELKALGKVGPEDPRAVFATTLQTQISDLQAAQRQWAGSIGVTTQAQAPDDAVWPRPTLTLFAAVLVGFGIGCGVALLTARVDRKLHGDAWDELPAPVLVRVPSMRSAPRNAPLAPDRADPIVSDAFAALGARLMLDRTGDGDGAVVVLVTSARSGEGKSSVAANLASAIAQGGRRVVLVDADMRKPTQSMIYPALEGRPGLSQVLVGAAQVEQSLTLVAANLAAVGSGPRQSNASTLLASVAFRTLVERLTNICEVVVIDAPPVLAVTDALSMAPVADIALLCARIGTSDANELEQAHSRLAGAAHLDQSIVLVGTERPRGYGYDADDAWPRPGTLGPAKPSAAGNAPAGLHQLAPPPPPPAAAAGGPGGAPPATSPAAGSSPGAGSSGAVA